LKPDIPDIRLDTLLPVIKVAASTAGQSVDRGRLQEAIEILRNLPVDTSSHELAQSAWQAAGLEGRLRELSVPTPADLPFIGWSVQHGWLLFLAQAANGPECRRCRCFRRP